MTTYVDTSTLIKFLIEEAGTAEARWIWAQSPELTSAGTLAVEARAALAAAHRGGRLNLVEFSEANHELRGLLGDVVDIELSPTLLDQAADLAEQEKLRGFDAIHLAAALEAEVDVLTSADRDLCTAAARNGILVANPLDLALDDEA